MNLDEKLGIKYEIKWLPKDFKRNLVYDEHGVELDTVSDYWKIGNLVTPFRMSKDTFSFRKGCFKTECDEISIEHFDSIFGLSNFKNENRKEGKEKMVKSNNTFNDMIKDFGEVENGEAALSFDGKIIVKNLEGEYVRYDKDTETIQNQTNLALEMSGMLYVMPVAEVFVDDIIKYKNTFCQVLEVLKNGSLQVINFGTGTKQKIIKEKSILGIDFFYKIVNLFTNGFGSSTTSENATTGVNSLFENPMLAMMMMSKNGDGNSSMKNLMLMQMMSGQTAGSQGFNPMMFLAMKDGDFDIKTLMLMNMLKK